MIPIEGSVLGNIVREAYKFAYVGKYDKAHIVRSPSEGGKIMPASKFFNQYKEFDNSFIVKPERLPFDPHINAVVLRNGGVILETARIDLETLAETISDRGYNFQVNGKSIYSGDEIIRTRTQNIGITEVNRRTVIKVVPSYKESGFEEALKVLDLIYHKDSFKPDHIPESIREIWDERRPELRQSLEIRQELQQFQKPQLLQTLSQNFYIVQQMKVLKMNSQELNEHVKKEVANNPALEIKS